ncbi:rRNA-processing arch domain-containing protein [Glomus cerebriforme]|uniref:rRNA-processing arch domain-containing protein n=1 Tax=Glomus cerebriforme TaxID=658196 RepID=A0A397TKR1_9GLOM|nr:rRNA-processing arch domain-containing protein [Glomus cerebriforme]
MSSNEKQQSPPSSTLYSKKRGLNTEKKRSKKTSERKKAKKQKLESPQSIVIGVSSEEASEEIKSKRTNKAQRASSSDAIEEKKMNKKSKDSNTEVVVPENIGKPAREEEMEEIVGDVLLQQDLVADSQYDEIIQPSLTPDIKQIHIPKVIPHDSIHPVVADTFEQRAISEPPVGYLSNNHTTGENVILSHQVRHQVALPPNYPYIPISQHVSPAEPARKYLFELDPFQKVAISCIERNESILVSAHTSAGKTVVAEYAIAQALRDKQRVIYTSPIKALSNQKFRELETKFHDVGLMTGDVTIRPEASCLVMTTEILLLMLYRGNDLIMREVSWVVFDEIHYMRDKVRGVVWEETIILLPHQVRFVFLSATIPNAMEFAEWICKTHAQPCHVVYTDFRPTPLQHYIHPSGSNGIFVILDEKGNFNEDSFRKATGLLQQRNSDIEYINTKKKSKRKKNIGGPASSKKSKKSRKSKKSKESTESEQLDSDEQAEMNESKDTKEVNESKEEKSGKETSDIRKIVRMIMQNDFYPAIIFSFGKRECENNALQMGKVTLNNEDEQGLVQQVFNNAIETLSEEDRNLPQIEHLIPFLKRGIAFHHSGLLPVLKEIVELLFQEGLIKILFATETFAMGLNMPAKTVVFTDLKKFDGLVNRYITSGEYIQMSGRAGRRGIDVRGIVIIMAREKMDPTIVKGIITGESDNLYSSFHLKYNMILNMTRVEGISPEYILQRSFYQFQNTACLPVLEEESLRLEEAYASFEIPNEDVIEEYYNIRKLLDTYAHDMRRVISHPIHSLQWLKPGRLVSIKHADMDFGWGMVVAYGKRKDPRNLNVLNKVTSEPSTSEIKDDTNKEIQEPQILSPEQYFVDVLLNCEPNSIVAKSAEGKTIGVRPCKENIMGEVLVVPVELSTIHCISSIRIFPPKILTHKKIRNNLYEQIQKVKNHFPEGIPILDPIEDMHIRDEDFGKLIRKIEILEAKLFANKLHKTQELPSLYDQYAQKVALSNKIKSLRKRINISNSILHLDDLKYRKRLLRRLNYLTDDDVVSLKGRVACHINAGDELVITEMIMNSVFNDMTAEHIVALLSCFVYENGDKKQHTLKGDLYVHYRRLQEVARNIVAVSSECKIDMIEEEYLATFCADMMEPVYEWCQGKSFAEVMKVSDSMFEGHVIRTFRMLDELLRGMVNAAKEIGDLELEEKFKLAIEKTRRGIVFAASLYTS